MNRILHHAPLIRLALPMLLGCYLGLSIDESFKLIFPLGMLALVVLALLLNRKSWKQQNRKTGFGVLITIGFFLAGICSAQIELDANEKALQLPEASDYYTAEVLTKPEQKTKSTKLELMLTGAADSSAHFTDFRIKIIAYADSSLQLESLVRGDRILVTQPVRPHQRALNPNQFDYGAHLKSKGFAGTTYFSKAPILLKQSRQKSDVSGFFENLRLRCIAIFKSYDLGNDELGVASALILGQKSYLDKELKGSFAAAGAIHILAVSGLHVGIIYLLLINLVKYVLPKKRFKLLSVALVIAALWCYAGITGFSPSVLRATTMFSFIALGKETGRTGNIYNMLAVSALVLTIINPSIVKEVGFQLSYIAVIGIAALFKPIYSLLIFKSWFADKAWSLLVVSFVAQLATFPLSIYYFGQFPNLFLISNLLVIPLATSALYSGLALLIIHWVPFIDILVAFCMKWILISLNASVYTIAAIPYSYTDGIYVTAVSMLGLYVLIISIILFISWPNRARLIAIFTIGFLLVAALTTRIFKQSQQIRFDILAGPKCSLITFTEGKKMWILSADTSSVFQASSKFYIDGFCDQNGITTLIWLPTNEPLRTESIIVENGILRFRKWQGIYDLTGIRSQKFGSIADFLLAEDYYGLKNFKSLSPDTYVILGSTLYPYDQERALAYCREKNWKVWNMDEQGAYSLK